MRFHFQIGSIAECECSIFGREWSTSRTSYRKIEYTSNYCACRFRWFYIVGCSYHYNSHFGPKVRNNLFRFTFRNKKGKQAKEIWLNWNNLSTISITFWFFFLFWLWDQILNNLFNHFIFIHNNNMSIFSKCCTFAQNIDTFLLKKISLLILSCVRRNWKFAERKYTSSEGNFLCC